MKRIGSLGLATGGNANTWAIYASAQGYKTGSVPVVGAIAVWDEGGEYGHVAYQTDVQVKTLSGIGLELQTSKQLGIIVLAQIF